MLEQGLDLAACLSAVRKQDQEAAQDLVAYLYPLVIKVVRSHLPRSCSEEDLAQEVFLKVFSRIEQYRAEMPFEHWVSRIAYTTCIDRLRFQKRRPELRWADLSENESSTLEQVLAADLQPNPSEALAARELVNKLLECLSPEDRLVITLLDLEEHSVVEIRQMTGWSNSMIKVRAFRARRKLRKHLEKLKTGYRHE